MNDNFPFLSRLKFHLHLHGRTRIKTRAGLSGKPRATQSRQAAPACRCVRKIPVRSAVNERVSSLLPTKATRPSKSVL